MAAANFAGPARLSPQAVRDAMNAAADMTAFLI
jgi:hypothetical protein